MHILLLLHSLSGGGQERQFLYLAQYFKEQNIEVSVIVAKAGGDLDIFIEIQRLMLL